MTAMLILAIAPQVWSASVPAVAQTSERESGTAKPAERFLTAYNSMTMADWLNAKGMTVETADIFAEALNLFEKLAADYPDWEPDVVAFRINYCRAALAKLQGVDHSAPIRSPPHANASSAAQKASAGTADGQAARRPSGEEASEIENRKSEITDPSPLTLRLQQAVLTERGRDYTGALAAYTAILKDFPREPWALKGACRCSLRLGDIDTAGELTRQALSLPLPDADLNLLAALTACQEGHYQAAIPLLRQALKQNSILPEAHAALGVALAAGGDLKEAQEQTKRALSCNPKLGDAYYNLARLSLRQKPRDLDTARVHYQNALRHDAAPDPELDALLGE
jgi:tetratricopeptide (TPR) repeat protein